MRPPAESEKELPCATIGARISQILRKLIAAGIDEVVVVKLPTEDLGISIVRVLIPDLQIPLHGQRTQVSRRALRQLLELAA
jgi:ribosomal protein S12 methylthiotransferase accessory factor YcaO